MDRKCFSKAFTLPELLLTAGILAFCLSVVLLSFISSVRLNQESRDLTTAVTHAEFVMETMKNVAFPNLAANITNGNYTWNTAVLTSNGLTALNNENITTTSSGTNPLTVTVMVAWNDMQGRGRSQVLETLMAQ